MRWLVSLVVVVLVVLGVIWLVRSYQHRQSPMHEAVETVERAADDVRDEVRDAVR